MIYSQISTADEPSCAPVLAAALAVLLFAPLGRVLRCKLAINADASTSGNAWALSFMDDGCRG